MVQTLEKEYQFTDFLQTFSPIFANLCIHLCQILLKIYYSEKKKSFSIKIFFTNFTNLQHEP
jgi:hypothetical protein